MRILNIVLLLVSSLHAFADVDAASRAYRNKDYDTAFEAFSESANNGDARSQTILAMMYKYGESTEVDLEQSFHWYLEAAMQGYPSAQYNVGMMLVNGEGVTADPEAAKEWLSRAVGSGHKGASNKLLEADRRSRNSACFRARNVVKKLELSIAQRHSIPICKCRGKPRQDLSYTTRRHEQYC